MLALIGFLVVLWVILAIVGAVVKGLLWLTWVAAVLFVATAVFYWIKRKISTRNDV